MSMFGLWLAGGSFLAFVAVYAAGLLADEPNQWLVMSGLGASVIGVIAGLTLTVAGVFV